MPKLSITAAEMVARARGRIAEIDAKTLIARQGDARLVIVDIRDVRERQRTGWIPGSVHAPRGMLEFWVDPDSPYHKPIFAEDKEFVFHCASGWRSALASGLFIRRRRPQWVQSGRNPPRDWNSQPYPPGRSLEYPPP